MKTAFLYQYILELSTLNITIWWGCLSSRGRDRGEDGGEAAYQGGGRDRGEQGSNDEQPF